MTEQRYSSADSSSIILSLSFGGFIKDAGQYVIWVIMSVYLYSVWRMPYLSIGLVFLISGLIAIPVTFYGGHIIDRYGRKRPAILISIAMSIFSVSLFLLVFYHYNLPLILSLFIASGPLQSFDYVIMGAIIADVTPESERINGFSSLRIASNIGIGVGLVMGGLLSMLNYSYVFILPASGYFIATLIIYFRIPETVPEASTDQDHFKLSQLLNPLKDRGFIMVSILLSMGWFITGMFESSLTPLYFESVNHIDSISITLLFAVNTVVVVVLQKPINRFVLKMRDSTRIITGVMFYAVAFAIFSITAQYAVLIMCVVILTIGENLQSPASSSMITKMAPENNRGIYLGLNSSISSMTSPFRPLLGSVFLTLFVGKPQLTWVLISTSCVAVAISLMISLSLISRNRRMSGLSSL